MGSGCFRAGVGSFCGCFAPKETFGWMSRRGLGPAVPKAELLAREPARLGAAGWCASGPGPGPGLEPGGLSARRGTEKSMSTDSSTNLLRVFAMAMVAERLDHPAIGGDADAASPDDAGQFVP